MGMHIDGWIEVSDCDRQYPEEDSDWQGVIRLLPLIACWDGVSEVLFGFSKNAVTEPERYQALARDRGVPAFCSQEVRHDLAIIQEHENKFGPGEIGGFTHATWDELKSITWPLFQVGTDDFAASDWPFVFAFMQQLASRYPDQGIRIIAWWVW